MTTDMSQALARKNIKTRKRLYEFWKMTKFFEKHPYIFTRFMTN